MAAATDSKDAGEGKEASSVLDSLPAETPINVEDYYLLHHLLGSACGRGLRGVSPWHAQHAGSTSPPPTQRVGRAQCTWHK